jgi:hypothetical protein
MNRGSAIAHRCCAISAEMHQLNHFDVECTDTVRLFAHYMTKNGRCWRTAGAISIASAISLKFVLPLIALASTGSD